MSLSELFPVDLVLQDEGADWTSVVPYDHRSKLEIMSADGSVVEAEEGLRHRFPRSKQMERITPETSRHGPLELLGEVVSRPESSLHNGQIGRRSLVVKVIKRSKSARTNFGTTMTSRLQPAEVPLAAALETDPFNGLTAGLELVAALASGISYLNVRGIVPEVENLVILRDIDKRFLIDIDSLTRNAARGQADSDAEGLLNSLCCNILTAANHILLDSCHSASLDNIYSPVMRREYVWTNIKRGPGSLGAVCRQAHLQRRNLPAPLDDMTSTHRCVNEVRSGVIPHVQSNDLVTFFPLLQIGCFCDLCHNLVGTSHETFRCTCGETLPGSRATVRCRECKSWSHRDCVGDPDDFICAHCLPSTAQVGATLGDSDTQIHHRAPWIDVPPTAEDEDMPTREDQLDLCCGSPYLCRGSCIGNPNRFSQELPLDFFLRVWKHSFSTCLNFFDSIYMITLLGLPSRYRKDMLHAQILSGNTERTHQTYGRWIAEWSQMGTAAGVLFGMLFTILQLPGASYDPLVRILVQLSMVCLFFGALFALLFSITFGRVICEHERFEWIHRGCERGTSNHFWNPWIALSMPLAWIIWGVFYFALLVLAFLWRSAADTKEANMTTTTSPSLLQGIGPQVMTSSIFALGTLYLGLIIATMRDNGRQVAAE
ncbi:hypothetical protein FB45DRAFT_1036274 [Roridomyces roridus]|uniref:Uncharacterized protein n=1 Tax=Roridomyces roridus TaxID=1738132 RepID=A0AAD7FBL3_9AGAR|nr:hypothetical protein FB45DRAFT_1036274 [Roridomyces roridus]